MYYVYTIMNEYGAVEYVGYTANLKRRMYGHKEKPRMNKNGLSVSHGLFYKRNDVSMVVVKECDTKEEAAAYEGQLKTELGFEWTELTGSQRGGRKGGAVNAVTGHIQRVARANNVLRRQPVLVYFRNTGEFVGEYESQSEAARRLGVNQGAICNVLKGNAFHAKGYYFEFKHNTP